MAWRAGVGNDLTLLFCFLQHSMPSLRLQQKMRTSPMGSLYTTHFLSNRDRPDGTQASGTPYLRRMLTLSETTQASPELLGCGAVAPDLSSLKEKDWGKSLKKGYCYATAQPSGPHIDLTGAAGAEGSRHRSPGSAIPWTALIDLLTCLVAGQTLCLNIPMEGQSWKTEAPGQPGMVINGKSQPQRHYWDVTFPISMSFRGNRVVIVVLHNYIFPIGRKAKRIYIYVESVGLNHKLLN